MNTLPRHVLVDTLLEALEAERYVRVPLLLTVIDELSAEPPLAHAASDAVRLLGALERDELAASDFAREVGALRRVVRGGLAPHAGPGTAATRLGDQRAKRSVGGAPAA